MRIIQKLNVNTMLILASLFISGLLIQGLKILFTKLISKLDKYYEEPVGLIVTNTPSKGKANTSVKRLLNVNDVPESDFISSEKGKEVFMPAQFHQIA
jgi:hypothetical protein